MATLATDLSCSTLVRRDFHPLGWFKRFRYLIFSSPSSELFPTRRRSVRGPAWPKFAQPDPGLWVCLMVSASHPAWVCKPAAQVAVDRFDFSALASVRPTTA